MVVCKVIWHNKFEIVLYIVFSVSFVCFIVVLSLSLTMYEAEDLAGGSIFETTRHNI